MEHGPNIAIVSSKDLGTYCWSALKSLSKCHLCSRYKGCKDPKKSITSEVKEKLEKIDAIEKEVAVKLEEANKLRAEVGHGRCWVNNRIGNHGGGRFKDE